MEIEIDPEPTPEERAAIEAALAEAADRPPPGRWWQAGLDADDDDR